MTMILFTMVDLDQKENQPVVTIPLRWAHSVNFVTQRGGTDALNNRNETGRSARRSWIAFRRANPASGAF